MDNLQSLSCPNNAEEEFTAGHKQKILMATKIKEYLIRMVRWLQTNSNWCSEKGMLLCAWGIESKYGKCLTADNCEQKEKQKFENCAFQLQRAHLNSSSLDKGQTAFSEERPAA